MPNAMLHKSGSGDPEEQQQQPNANNNNHQHHHQHHDDDALRAQNAGDADSDADADSPAAGKSLNVDDRINGSGGAGGGGGGGGGGAGAGGVVGGRPALKEHDFVGGVGAGGGSGDEKRATVNGRSEVDFETELRLGPPSEAVAQAPKTRAASYEPKFFNNGHEVSGTPAAFLLPPAKNAGIGMAVVGAGAKRVFSELQGGATRMGLLQLPLPLDAVDGGGKGTLMYPWPPQQQQQPQPSSSAEQQQQRVVLVSDSTHEVAKRPPLPPSAEFLNKNPSQSQSQSQSQSHNNNHHHGSRVAPVVGWPPIRSFRKNLAPQPKPGTEAQQQQQQAAANGSGCGSGNSHAPFAVVNHQQQQQHHHHHHHQLPHKSFPETMFVKVNMDGVAIGRKIDLKAFDGYAQFSQALEEMFKRFVTAQGNSQKPCDNVASESEQAQSYVFGGGDFVLTYEDNEGDRMLVGDVPWEMFVSTVKRLRIMKSAEAQCLAPRSPLKAQQGQLTQE